MRMLDNTDNVQHRDRFPLTAIQWCRRQWLRAFFLECRRRERRKRARLEPFPCPDQPDCSLEVAVVVRHSDVALLHYCLKTLFSHERVAPQLTLIGDSDDATLRLREHFAFLKRSIEIRSGPALIAGLEAPTSAFIRRWEKSQPFGGFARKFGATLALNAERSFLLIDADVLWFGPWLEALLERTGNERILASIDYQHSYDSAVNELLPGGDLFAHPPINCGVIYYPRGVFSKHLKPDEMAQLESLTQNAHPHLEQAIIGKVFLRSSGDYLEKQWVTTHMRDAFRLRPEKSHLLRHYAGAQHLFWRDAT